ncbi:SMP-30/gluconolactonase/LRE family protein [Paenibacillus sp. JX-17]|uniref:Regucalcin n=2 Tax=Paenibacillus lacisoli TaxID=3064525 RepID=A0ABT9C9G6_9BACL|nr:SMP-30/gluconolactonase/LRE family protein [Paenibacillus sp. JX-17]MDO7905894.1 SMP-30/gluconolactonase/LRE family protein [Paenibacillus sp. JX-17]
MIDAKAELGEGPCWDAERGRLLWVDIEGFNLHVFDPETGRNDTYHIGQYVSAVVPYQGDEVLVTLAEGFHRLNLANGELIKLVDPEQKKPRNRFNDGKCDPAGRFWAGTMSLDGVQGEGALYCLEPDGRLRMMLDGVSTSNGLGWSLDAATMYYIDTPTRRVDQFDYNLDKGNLAHRRPVIRLTEEMGYPDGMTMDAEGMLWIAEWGGGRVGRWNPSTGQLMSVIELPADQVTSCCFGGAELDELYITTARSGLSAERLEETPLAGALFRVKPGVKGLLSTPYGYAPGTDLQK